MLVVFDDVFSPDARKVRIALYEKDIPFERKCECPWFVASFLGLAPDPRRHSRIVAWLDRFQQRPAVVRDDADVLETLSRLQAEKRSAFDPYRAQ